MSKDLEKALSDPKFFKEFVKKKHNNFIINRNTLLEKPLYLTFKEVQTKCNRKRNKCFYRNVYFKGFEGEEAVG